MTRPSVLLILALACACTAESPPLSSALAAAGEHGDCESAYRNRSEPGDPCTGEEYEPGRVYWACAGIDDDEGCIYAATCEDYSLTYVHRHCATGSDSDPVVWDDCDHAAVAGRQGEPCDGSWVCAEPMTGECARSVSCNHGVLDIDEGCLHE